MLVSKLKMNPMGLTVLQNHLLKIKKLQMLKIKICMCISMTRMNEAILRNRKLSWLIFILSLGILTMG